MVSRSRLHANRANAQKSSGPKTGEGKARSSRNACKHGLRTKVISDPHYRNEFLALRHRLLTENGQSSTFINPLSLAMTELRRVTKVRQSRLEDALQTLEAGEAMNVSTLISELETLERYERRAHYRLHRAIEAYAPGHGAPPSRKQHLPKFGRQTRPL